MEQEIVNKVAQSGLITLDLETYIVPGERVVLDIKPWLFQELLLKEKDFRQYVKDHDWSVYKDKLVAITCSSDAIIPAWAYMLVASKLEPYTQTYVQGSLETLETVLFETELKAQFKPTEYAGARLIIKGCGEAHVPASAYVTITRMLTPYAKSIMYGEACSSVPVFKNKIR